MGIELIIGNGEEQEAIGIGQWPDRKLPTLYHRKGAVVYSLATLRSAEAAEQLCELLRTLARGRLAEDA